MWHLKLPNNAILQAMTTNIFAIFVTTPVGNLKTWIGILQGQSWQTGFLKLALRDRNMQVRFFWKVVLKS